MNISIILLAMGVLLLFIRQTAWAGIALIGIGIVTYFFVKKQPNYNYFDPRLRQKFQRVPQQPGVDWDIRENINQAQRTPDMPKIDDGMFSLPLPMGDLSEIMDVRHKTKIK